MTKTETQECACGFSGAIDVHAHFLPECYYHALHKANLVTLDGGFPVPQWNPDLALQTMDALDVATAIISVSSPSTHFLPIESRAGLCRQINESGADLVSRYPSRFGLFASLPLPDVAASLKEIDFAFEQLGADGVILESNIDGEYLGSPRFAPIFAELNRRGSVVFLHPTSPACYEAVALGRPAPLLEFPLDTTRTIVDLLYTRTLQTNPDIKLIVPHGGAALSSLAARIAVFANVPFINPRPVSEEEVFSALENLYYDVALCGHAIPLSALRLIAPIKQILFGSDWPFTPDFGVARNIGLLNSSACITEVDKRAIAHENALRILPRLAKYRASS